MLTIIILTVFLSTVPAVYAQSAYEKYIDEYAEIAVAHQEEFGIPASITLAQGLLESGAGRSTLATEANNHFGIKCHKEWTGNTVKRHDDAPDECFRAYETAAESFTDHSRFLKRGRYSRLFSLDVTDYKGWATGLRECGYATDPHYAAKLITIIERYNLYEYDMPGAHDAESTSAFIRDMLVRTHPVRRSRGLHYVVATPGDTYGGIAREFNIPLAKLLAHNDMEEDGEIKEWEEVYLEGKLETAPEGVTMATIGTGESLHSVAQRYGMKMAILRGLNPTVKDREGSRLRLCR